MPVFIAFICGDALFYLFQFFPFIATGLFVASAAYAFFKRKVLLIPVIVTGILFALLRFTPSPDSLSLWNKELKLTGRFVPKTTAPTANPGLKTFSIDNAFDDETGDEIEELHDEDMSVLADFEPDYDGEYELVVKAGSDKTRLNPGGFNSGRLYGSVIHAEEKDDAAFSLFTGFNTMRARLNEYMLGRFSADSAALTASVTTGEMSYLSDEIRDAFNVTGLAHILSISGSHFGLFSVVIFSISIFFIKRLPYRALQRLTMYLTPQQTAAVLSIPFMIFYLGISGGGPPAVRSFIMIILFLAGLLLGRKGFWLNSLLFAAFLLVLWEPGVLMNLSFQLSFLAVLFIGFSFEKREDEGAEAGNKYLRMLRDSLKITLAATIGTAPLVAYHFHYFPLISPLSNLIAGPLIGFVLVPLSLVSSISFLITGHYIFAPLVGISADLSVAAVKLLAKVPLSDLRIPAFPPVLCVVFYGICLMYVVSGVRKKILAAPIILFVIYAIFYMAGKKELSVTFLDVGQGDSSVVEFPDGRAIVIDTGRTGREAASFLKYLGKRTIDVIALSHLHPDHTGGLEYLSAKFQVGEIWDNGFTEYPEAMKIYAKRKALTRGDYIDAGTYRITALHPYKEYYSLHGDENAAENNSSQVLKISGKHSAFLFTGDIEEDAEQDICHLGSRLSADVIKIPHHGGRTSSGEEFLAEVSPSIAVISAGRGNSYGHPHPETLERLEGRRVFRTDQDGAVKIIETDTGLAIKTYKDFALEKARGYRAEWKNVKRLFNVW